MPQNASVVAGDHPVDSLEQQLKANWAAIRKARSATAAKKSILQDAFQDKIPSDTTLVVFGSIAREEVTSGSDSDWILLVDGQAVPEHSALQHFIAGEMKRLKFSEPWKAGPFGRMVGSHDIVHEIGGEDDTNANTTRRVLLLLESLPVGKREAYDRVRRQILNRYIKDDRGLVHASGKSRIPRFLLNDLTRYWRTVTVDFVYKQRAEAGKKWALRNAKLRMSRKLIFASGLLRCFFCQLDPNASAAREALGEPQLETTKLLTYLEEQLRQTPLDVLATAALRPTVDVNTRRKLFDSYDHFLAVLDDSEKRSELQDLKEDQIQTSKVWKEIRDLSAMFHSGLVELFFGNDRELCDITVQYGVF
jgi:predicted nucleotidyltransferase